jgi:hypothetical protein
MANRHEMFKKRLQELGCYAKDDADGVYDGMIGEAVEELSETFANQGHSGMSANIVTGLFASLMKEYNDPKSTMWARDEET